MTSPAMIQWTQRALNYVADFGEPWARTAFPAPVTLLAETGILDHRTIVALTLYQQARGLHPDGHPGPRSTAALSLDLREKMPHPLAVGW
jgi:hypothetical protein